jgi:integrase
MPAPATRVWEYGGYWISGANGTANLYAYWYDKRTGSTRRRTLGTEVLSEAQGKLIALVGSAQRDGSKSPDRVMISVALDHYYEHDIKAKPSANIAFRAVILVNEYLAEKIGPTAAVSTFGPIRQKEFMSWSAAKYGHSAGTIARNLSVVSAAFRFGKRLSIIKDGFGNEQEIQLLDTAPDVVTQSTRVADLISIPDSTPRDWLPTFKELGGFIDAIDKRQENLFRFVILALNTWSRPEALIDFRMAQVDREFGTLDLNPRGRRQTDKYRPTIRLTDNLAGWLDYWRSDAPLIWDGAPITTMKKTFKRHALACGFERFTQDTIRHFMATYVRRSKPPVSQEQRDAWLGHNKKRTANWYEHNDPEFLIDAKIATDSILRELQEYSGRPLFACKARAKLSFRTINGGKKDASNA